MKSETSGDGFTPKITAMPVVAQRTEGLSGPPFLLTLQRVGSFDRVSGARYNQPMLRITTQPAPPFGADNL